MEESLRGMAQVVDLLERHECAWEDKEYREALRQASKKPCYVNPESKVITLRQMVARDLGFQVAVNHPRLCHLCLTDDSAPQKNRGTPPVPKPDAQGQFPRRPSKLPARAVDDEAAARLRRVIYELDRYLTRLELS
ncbi:hypothetical protein PGTUg99_029221 [Puccinia graminis f. sp. tritici]|uniref:Uncharacterized protein n=1 Tax=Puccinia graminis f. sp. tritici TaxID=56615 RepID=A0A5B0R6T7_PUCGR|nr:hypothetical protein PGTUg99_029221 [Puccinia graminis f. sp. tritici]